VLLSPYFEVKEEWYYFGKPEAWAVRMSRIKHFVKKLKIGQIKDPDGLKRYDAYEYLPLKAIGELPKLGAFAKEKAKKVTSEILWIHSSGDIVADYEESRKSFDSIPSKKKRFISYERSNHIILYDYDSRDAIKQIIQFLTGKEH
jgi:esterase/lipase